MQVKTDEKVDKILLPGNALENQNNSRDRDGLAADNQVKLPTEKLYG